MKTKNIMWIIAIVALLSANIVSAVTVDDYVKVATSILQDAEKNKDSTQMNALYDTLSSNNPINKDPAVQSIRDGAFQGVANPKTQSNNTWKYIIGAVVILVIIAFFGRKHVSKILSKNPVHKAQETVKDNKTKEDLIKELVKLVKEKEVYNKEIAEVALKENHGKLDHNKLHMLSLKVLDISKKIDKITKLIAKIRGKEEEVKKDVENIISAEIKEEKDVENPAETAKISKDFEAEIKKLIEENKESKTHAEVLEKALKLQDEVLEHLSEKFKDEKEKTGKLEYNNLAFNIKSCIIEKGVIHTDPEFLEVLDEFSKRLDKFTKEEVLALSHIIKIEEEIIQKLNQVELDAKNIDKDTKELKEFSEGIEKSIEGIAALEKQGEMTFKEAEEIFGNFYKEISELEKKGNASSNEISELYNKINRVFADPHNKKGILFEFEKNEFFFYITGFHANELHGVILHAWKGGVEIVKHESRIKVGNMHSSIEHELKTLKARFTDLIKQDIERAGIKKISKSELFSKYLKRYVEEFGLFTEEELREIFKFGTSKNLVKKYEGEVNDDNFEEFFNGTRKKEGGIENLMKYSRESFENLHKDIEANLSDEKLARELIDVYNKGMIRLIETLEKFKYSDEEIKKQIGKHFNDIPRGMNFDKLVNERIEEKIKKQPLKWR